MRRFVSLIFGIAFSVTAMSLLTAIVVLGSQDRALERDHGAGPGLALVIILKS